MNLGNEWGSYLLAAPLVAGFALLMLVPLYALVRWAVGLFGSPQEDSIWRPFVSLLLWAVQAYYWFQLLTLGRNGGHPFGIAPVVLEAFGASLVCWIVAGVLAATAPKAIEEEKDEVGKTHIDVSLR